MNNVCLTLVLKLEPNEGLFMFFWGELYQAFCQINN